MSHPVLTTEFLLGFLESYPAALVVFELDGTIVYINQLGCEGAKQSREELIGKQIQDLAADPASAEIATPENTSSAAGSSRSDGTIWFTRPMS